VTTQNEAAKLATVLALLVGLLSAAAAPAAQVDHILLGIDDLDRGVQAFEESTGIKPVYGGKHPGGTHNALVSLGDGTYLEIIAVQKGVAPPADFAGIEQLHTLTPIGWAVSSKDSAELRKRLDAAGLAVTASTPRLAHHAGGQDVVVAELRPQRQFRGSAILHRLVRADRAPVDDIT
jgi:hypothetical protein